MSTGSGNEEQLANMLVMTTAIRAVSTFLNAGEGNDSQEDLLGVLSKDAAASTRNKAQQLLAAIGPQFGSYQEAEYGPGTLHLNLGSLLDLDSAALDTKLGQVAEALGVGTKDDLPGNDTSAGSTSLHANTTQYMQSTPAGATSNHTANESSTNSLSDASKSSYDIPAHTRHLQQIVAKISRTEQQIRNGSVSISHLPDDTLLGTLLQAAFEDIRSTQAARKASLAASLGALWQVDWPALQDKIHAAGRRIIDMAINRLPRIKWANRLEEIFKIVVDRLTGGQGQGRGCSPYIFNPGGTPLPEIVILPSFSLSQTLGNCVLIPELIGNVDYPGQWALANSRIACLGPSTEYLLVPAFYRSAATAAESFACPTCRNEFSIGPAVTLTLIGDAQGVVRYINKAEFLAALKTNTTFHFGRAGLDAALQALSQKLQHKEVLEQRLGLQGTTGAFINVNLGLNEGLLGMLSTWIETAREKWQQAVQQDDVGAAIQRLSTQMGSTAG